MNGTVWLWVAMGAVVVVLTGLAVYVLETSTAGKNFTRWSLGVARQEPSQWEKSLRLLFSAPVWFLGLLALAFWGWDCLGHKVPWPSGDWINTLLTIYLGEEAFMFIYRILARRFRPAGGEPGHAR